MRPMAMKPALFYILSFSVVLCGCNASKQAASTPAPTPTPTAATATVAVGTQPQAVAVNSVTNQIYVANEGSNTVTVLTP